MTIMPKISCILFIYFVKYNHSIIPLTMVEIKCTFHVICEITRYKISLQRHTMSSKFTGL